MFPGARGMTQWLGALVAFTEEQAQFPPSTQRLTAIWNSCSIGLWCILISTSTQYTHGCRYSTKTHKVTKSKRENLFSPTCLMPDAFIQWLCCWELAWLWTGLSDTDLGNSIFMTICQLVQCTKITHLTNSELKKKNVKQLLRYFPHKLHPSGPQCPRSFF